MDWKKTGKALLLPPTAVLILLLPISIGILVYAFLFWEESNPLRIVSYVLSFYTLTVWCVRMPNIIRSFRHFKNNNRYAQLWLGDTRLRMKIVLSGNVLFNGAYASLQLGLGIYHHSLWFGSLAAYYYLLAIMRFFLARYTIRYQPGKRAQQELRYYHACGWIFLCMNIALSGMMLNMIRENRMVRHHEITTIAMATYTFATLTLAIINVIRYRKYNSPVYSASKAISLASACVSMLTLEATMLTTFRTDSITAQTQILFLALTGGAVSAFIIAMAIYMIVSANRKIHSHKTKQAKDPL